MTGRPKIVGVIQARMNSTRLPGKIMMPLAGAPMLQRLIQRVSRSRMLDDLVVATTDTLADDPVETLCSQLGIRCHRGSESDALGRMLDAADTCNADVMVRLTGDNPFVDGTLVDLVVGAYLSSGDRADYAHNVDDCVFPFGLFVEVCSIDALREAARHATAEEREHVTLYVRRRPDSWKHLAVTAPGQFTEERLSIDTREDYERLSALFAKRHAADPAFGYVDFLVKAEAG